MLWVSILLLAVLFGIDTQLPLGVAGGIPYIAVVLYSAGSPFRPLPYLVALAATLLTVAGAFLSGPGATYLIGFTNRSLAIGAIWMVAVLADRRTTAEALRLEERYRSEEKLRAANQELESFSQVLSHDLRNQLTPVIYTADFLREEYGHCLGVEGSRMVTEVGNRGRRMSALMEDLLQLASVGRLDAPEQPCDVESVVSNVLADLDERIRRTGMKVVRLPLAAARVPETLMGQVFGNLIANALNYADDPGGELELGSVVHPGYVRYFVRDHGRGIPEEEREVVFESFRRGAAQEGTRGSGIGLAIVRKVAALYGGGAWVEETPGGGATFWVEVRVQREK